MLRKSAQRFFEKQHATKKSILRKSAQRFFEKQHATKKSMLRKSAQRFFEKQHTTKKSMLPKSAQRFLRERMANGEWRIGKRAVDCQVLRLASSPKVRSGFGTRSKARKREDRFCVAALRHKDDASNKESRGTGLIQSKRSLR
jgi:hypothetical protein